jgi:hypothetical protein
MKSPRGSASVLAKIERIELGERVVVFCVAQMDASGFSVVIECNVSTLVRTQDVLLNHPRRRSFIIEMRFVTQRLCNDRLTVLTFPYAATATNHKLQKGWKFRLALMRPPK